VCVSVCECVWECVYVCILALFIQHAKRIFSARHYIVICCLSDYSIFFYIIS